MVAVCLMVSRTVTRGLPERKERLTTIHLFKDIEDAILPYHVRFVDRFPHLLQIERLIFFTILRWPPTSASSEESASNNPRTGSLVSIASSKSLHHPWHKVYHRLWLFLILTVRQFVRHVLLHLAFGVGIDVKHTGNAFYGFLACHSYLLLLFNTPR